MVKHTEQKMSIRFFSTVSARKVEWLWFPYIPYGKLTIVQGDPGDGKTTLVLNIAALLSKGLPMPDAEREVSCTKIIYQSAEDGAEDTLKPRLESAGADCSKIAFIDDIESNLKLNDDRIESAIREIGARLMVIDPLQAYLCEGNEMNRADAIRPMMKSLTAVAERTGCAIVIIGHMNKSGSSKGIYRGLGSIDITAAARSVLLVGRLKNNPGIRVMAQLKNSLAMEGKPIAFEIHEDASVCWIGEYDITAEELLSGEEPQGGSGKLDEAVGQLEAIMSSGAVRCGEIYAMLSRRGIGKRTVDRAKKKLEVKSIKRADAWYWSLNEVANRQQ